MDYRGLLVKYVRFLMDVEGSDFIDSGYRAMDPTDEFTFAEWAELNAISDEARLRTRGMSPPADD